MRLLHLSDLHIRSTWEADQNRVISAFLRDLGKQCEDRPVDVVVFSGDLAFSAHADQYQFAEQHLLAPIEEVTGVPRDRIILAPGNHDVDISKIDRFSEQGLQSLLTSRDAVNALLDDRDSLTKHIERLGPWLEFQERYYDGCSISRISPLVTVHNFLVGDVTVGAASLTSAWRATGAPNDGDLTHLLVGDRQVSEAAQAVSGADFRIAVMHHPINWLAVFDQMDVKRELTKNFHLLCTGHIHVDDPQAVHAALGTMIHSASGSMYHSRDYLNSFSILDIDAQRMDGTISVRSYWDSRDDFDAASNVAPNGIVRISFEPVVDKSELPESRFAPADLAAEALVESVREKSMLTSPDIDNRTMSELLVPPVFLPLPVDQYISAKDLKNGIELERADIRSDFAGTNFFLIVGEESSGLTSALQWLTYEAYAMDNQLAPILIDHRAVGSGQSGIVAEIRKKLALAGIPASPKDLVPRLALAVDNIDLSRPKSLARLLELIRQGQQSKLFLGCRRSDEPEITRALSQLSDTALTRYLGNFGRRELRGLIELVAPENPEDVMKSVLALLDREKLPRTPGMMAALVSIIANDQTWSAGTNDTAVLEAYVGMLLGRGDIAEDLRFQMDYRDRQHILSALAEKLIRENTQAINRVDAEGFLFTYFQSLGWSEPPGSVLDSFVSRRVLSENRGSIRFRHPSLLSLLAAQGAMDSVGFRDWILRDPIGNSQIIRHAAALRRSDRSLLQKVSETFKDVRSQMESAGQDPFTVMACAEGWAGQEQYESLVKKVWPFSDDNEQNIPLPDREDEAFTDALDAIDAITMAVSKQPDEIWVRSQLQTYSAALSLASSTLSNSELVQDTSLKAEVLREILNGYAVYAALLSGDESLKEFILEAPGSFSEDSGLTSSQLDEIRERITLFAPVFSAWYAMSKRLASNKLTGLVEDALQDPAFSEDPGQALMGTLLAHLVGVKNWAQYAESLLVRHGDRRVVIETLRAFATISYLAPDCGQQESVQLESLLAEIAVRNIQIPRNYPYREDKARFNPGSAKARLVRDLRGRRSRLMAASRVAVDPFGNLI
ncbi:metallophosphoesterase [Streptomyces sp. NPDC054783]